ncbi:MAG: CRISPR-associated helicase Cas3', partial [Nitrososphaeria archaeon]
MEFRSHPDKLLRDHLREVAESAKALVSEAGREDLARFAEIAGATHDIGKYTDMFQEHLRNGRRNCSDHALISSLVAFHEALRRTGNELYSFLVMTSVYSHHGHLKGITELYERMQDLDDPEVMEPCLYRQYRDIEKKWDPVIRKELLWFNLQELPPLDELVKEARKVLLNLKGAEHGWKAFLDGLLMFSALIDADKHSASGVEAESPQPQDPALVEKYVQRLRTRTSEINMMREQLFSWAKSLNTDKSVLMLSAPTGSGKTLSATLIGLRRGKRRLIYSLPYISIIEQTSSILSEIFGADSVLSYNHMTYVKEATEESEESDLERKMLLIESWQSPIVVTTFESFISSFLSSSNSNLKRLHNIAGSFVILDEVQSLPLELVALVYEAIEEVSRHLKVDFLIMSATIPFAMTDVERPIKTSPNRYTIHVGDLDDFLTPAELVQNVDLSGGSVLIELNTISAAEEAYKELRRMGHEPEYLSTRVIPKERRSRIQRLRERLSRKESVSLVSTQIVEAGVDLDFARGYRDLGPLDSIVQAAGRVNRNAERDSGDLYVYRIKRADREDSDFRLVYGKLTERIALETLKE